MSDQFEESIFSAAVEMPLEERAAYLDQACAGRPELRKSVESLLDAYLHGSYLEPARDTTSEVAALADETGDLVGPYKLLEKIGEGGMGVVYMAEQRQPVKRRVALKIIKLGMDTKQVIIRFEAERQALAMMDHPNIAKVFDAGATETGRPYFVMELVKGIKITEYCDRNEVTIRDRLELFVRICQAIQHAHQKGIIHRDIKPSNILVTLHDGVPVPKVIDFGIAKATRTELTEKTLFTQFHQMIGTPAYMSPEQAEMSGLDVDTRSDIYSLGVLLYELLTGKTPLDGMEMCIGGFDEMRRRISQEEPLKPSTTVQSLHLEGRTEVAKHRGVEPTRLGNELKGDLDWIVMKALEKDRTRRYETANGLSMDIQRHLSEETVLAHPPSATYRIQKLVRRNKYWFAAVGAVSLALVFGVLGITWQAIRASRAEREALTEAGRANLESAKARQFARQNHIHSYAADMKAAEIALRGNNLGYAVRLLERYFPAPGEEDLRGVEWRYLWQASRSSALSSFDQHSFGTRAVFSPDGRYVAAVSFDGLVQIWDVSSGSRIAQFDGYHGEDPKQALAFSPDGQLLACGYADGVILRDTSSWEVTRQLKGGGVPVVFSADGTLLAAESNGNVQLWDTATWEKSCQFETELSGTSLITHLAFSPDTRLLAISRNGHVQLWELASQSRVYTFKWVSPASLAFVPRSPWLAVGTTHGTLLFLNLETKQVDATYQVHPRYLMGLAFAPDGNRLATGGADQIVHLWNCLRESGGPPRLQKIRSLTGHENEIWTLDFSRDGRLLVSASKGGTVKVWNTTTARSTTFPWDAGSDQWLLGFSDDGKRIHTLTPDQRKIHSWNVANLEPVGHALRLPSDTVWADRVFPAGIMVQGDAAAWGTVDGTVQVRDLSTGRSLAHIRAGKGRVVPVGLSPDKRRVFVWDFEKEQASLWNFETGTLEALFPDYQGDPSSGSYYTEHVAFSPDGRWLAFPVAGFGVRLWDIVERRNHHTLNAHKWRTFIPSFSPTGRLLATSSWDGEATLWDVVAGRQLLPSLRGHLGAAHSTVFSPAGRTLITSGLSDGVHFWNVTTGKQMLTLEDAEEGHLSPDGRTLILRQEDTFHILRLPSLEEIDATSLRGVTAPYRSGKSTR